MRQLSEAHIERTITGYLQLDGWRALKTNPTSNRARGKGFGEIGMADVLYLRYSSHKSVVAGASSIFQVELLWAEFKRITTQGRTTKAAPHQREWHERERARGAATLIVGEDCPATVEGIQDWYRNSGLRRLVR